ncbi:MAG: hypothetical protein RL226_2271 [Bacteroidota bacterium]
MYNLLQNRVFSIHLIFTTMSRILLFLLVLPFTGFAQTCDPSNGNVLIYANYDGGIININCNENIPNLKIGVCTYEDCQINITGPFAGNVTQVIYAGFQGNNDNCNAGVNTTSISGVSPGITSILFAPPGVLSDSNGYPSIICAYSCGPGNQGGCNTAAQVVAYFMNQFGGTLHTYYTQYQCWGGETFNVSDDLCCSVPLPGVEATFTASDPIVCSGQCIDFVSSVSGNPTTYNWIFNGAQTLSSNAVNPTGICYLTPGSYTAQLTVSNATSSDVYSLPISVISCGTPGCTYPDALNFNPNATVDNQSCEFPCSNECPEDINQDGIINAADLLMFLGVFGTTCN